MTTDKYPDDLRLDKDYEQINHPNGVTTWKTKPKEKPEALRLSDALDFGDSISVKANADNAAAELRRLHALNQELLEALKISRNWIVSGGAQIGWSVDRIDSVLAKAQGASNE